MLYVLISCRDQGREERKDVRHLAVMKEHPKDEVYVGLPCGVDHGRKQAQLIAGSKLTLSRSAAS